MLILTQLSHTGHTQGWINQPSKNFLILITDQIKVNLDRVFCDLK